MAYGATRGNMVGTLTTLGTLLAILLPAGLVSLVISAKLLGEYLGTLWTAALKLAAVIILPLGTAIWLPPLVAIVALPIFQLLLLGRLFPFEPYEVGLIWVILTLVSGAAVGMVVVGMGMTL